MVVQGAAAETEETAMVEALFRLLVIFRPLACSCFAARAKGWSGEKGKVEKVEMRHFWDLLALRTTRLGEKLVFGNMDN